MVNGCFTQDVKYWLLLTLSISFGGIQALGADTSINPGQTTRLKWGFSDTPFVCRQVNTAENFLSLVSEHVYATTEGVALLAEANHLSTTSKLVKNQIIVVPNPNAQTSAYQNAPAFCAKIFTKSWHVDPVMLLGISQGAYRQVLASQTTSSLNMSTLPRLSGKLTAWRGRVQEKSPWFFGIEGSIGRYEPVNSISLPMPWTTSAFFGKRNFAEILKSSVKISAALKLSVERFAQVAPEATELPGQNRLGSLNTRVWWLGANFPFAWRALEVEPFLAYGFGAQSSFSDFASAPTYSTSGFLAGSTARLGFGPHLLLAITFRYFLLKGSAPTTAPIQLSNLDGSLDAGWRF